MLGVAAKCESDRPILLLSLPVVSQTVQQELIARKRSFYWTLTRIGLQAGLLRRNKPAGDIGH
jgi:hypothetical protein